MMKKSNSRKQMALLIFLECFIFLLFLLIDQLVKYWVQANISLGEVVPLINGVIGLTYTQNTGAAFSIFSNGFYFLLALRIVLSIAMVFILAKYHKRLNLMLRVGMSLVLSGAVGNIIDQICFGYVRDMFQFLFVNFAIFNVADICITLGCVILVIGFLKKEKAAS